MFKKSINNIIIIFAVLISIPAIIFSVDEISSLNQTESVIDKVYNEQLNTILATVDQYTYDVINGWTRKINLLIVNYKNKSDGKFNSNVDEFLSLNPTIRAVIFSDLNNTGTADVYSLEEDSLTSYIKFTWNDIIKSNIGKIKKILSLNQDSIRRIEACLVGKNDSEEIFFFPLDYTNNQSDFCGLLVNPSVFIKKNLAPEIKKLSHGEFTVSVTNAKTHREVILSSGQKLGSIQQQKRLMLLPNYAAAIFLKGKTIAQLVKERANRNLLTIFVIDIVLFVGIWFMLKNLRKEIELTKIKSDFISNVSHELRTPLALISLFSETLAENRIASTEKKNEYYKIIYQESSRLSRIVDKILSFYKIEGKKKTYNFNNVDLNSVIENVLETYNYHLSNSGFKYKFEKDPHIPLINGDEEAIAEAVINLIDNAMKYSTDIKEIEISTSLKDSFAMVKIKDYGIGIPLDKQKKIFEKFYRAQDKNTPAAKGAGLGLAIVKNIIDEHKGSITIESSEGQGSCFTLKFPVIPEFNKRGNTRRNIKPD